MQKERITEYGENGMVHMGDEYYSVLKDALMYCKSIARDKVQGKESSFFTYYLLQSAVKDLSYCPFKEVKSYIKEKFDDKDDRNFYESCVKREKVSTIQDLVIHTIPIYMRKMVA